MHKTNEQLIEQAATFLSDSHSILFITGAGISADSGIPTYRGIGGLWTQNNTIDDVPLSEIMTGAMIRSNPELTWRAFSQMEQICRGVSYNDAHKIIADMEKSFERVWILTQNVDGLHTQAGSRNVIEIHGNLRNLYCRSCDYQEIVTDFAHLPMPPLCPTCGAVVRPDVVLFGEMLPGRKLVKLAEEMERGFDLVFTIGTTSKLPYIQGPIIKSRERGIPVVEINIDTTKVSDIVDIKLKEEASSALTKIWDLCRQK